MPKCPMSVPSLWELSVAERREIETLRRENGDLKSCVIQLSTMIIRNVVRPTRVASEERAGSTKLNKAISRVSA
jgi:hypothetical protein